MSYCAYFLPIQIHNIKIHKFYQLCLVIKTNKMIFCNNNLLFNFKCKKWNVRSINFFYDMKNLMKGLKFLSLYPKPSWTWKLHKNLLQMNSYQPTKFLIIFEIVLSAILYTSFTIHKVFPIPSLYNDITTLFSTEMISLIWGHSWLGYYFWVSNG